MTEALTPIQMARWTALMCLLVYAVMLTIKARRTARRVRDLEHRLSNTKELMFNYKSLLAGAKDDVSYYKGANYALTQRLGEPIKFNYDLTEAPSGTLQLLTVGGGRLIEPLGSVKRAQDMGIVAWAPVAERDKQEEIRLGLIPPP